MIVGGSMVFIWKFLIAPHGGLLGIYELLPAFLSSAAAIVIISLLTAPPSQEIIDELKVFKPYMQYIQECSGILVARCASCNCMTYFNCAPL
ncbi:MAG: hypothetical protein ACLUD0_07275 [Eubacterium ramulus]